MKSVLWLAAAVFGLIAGCGLSSTSSTKIAPEEGQDGKVEAPILKCKELACTGEKCGNFVPSVATLDMNHETFYSDPETGNTTISYWSSEQFSIYTLKTEDYHALIQGRVSTIPGLNEEGYEWDARYVEKSITLECSAQPSSLLLPALP